VGVCGVAEREVEELAEVDEVGRIDVGLADDGDGLAGASIGVEAFQRGRML